MKLLVITVALLAFCLVQAQTDDSWATAETEVDLTDAPQTETPKAEEITEIVTEALEDEEVAETVTEASPETEEPRTEEPATEAPQTEEPETEKVTEVVTEEPATEVPETEAPQTEEPQTEEVTENVTEDVTEDVTEATDAPASTATATLGTPITRKPTTSAELPTTESPGHRSHVVCSCMMTTGLLGLNSIPVNDLIGSTVTGFERASGRCGPETYTECRDGCKLLVPYTTHGFDLTVVPKGENSNGKTLAGRICSRVGTQAFFSRVGLRAEVRCDGPSQSRPNYISSNLMSSKQRLSCVVGLPVTSPF